MISPTGSEKEHATACGLIVSHRIFCDRREVGLITRSELDHYDAVPFDGERFDLPESQRLFGSDFYAIAMRLTRIGCTVVPCSKAIADSTSTTSRRIE